jgi:hypothetical protein
LIRSARREIIVLYVIAGVLFRRRAGPGVSDGAILAFIWFAATLSARLRAAEAEGGWLSRIPLISGAGFVVLAVSAAAVNQFVADAIDDNPGQFEVDPDTARLLTNGAYTLSPEAAFLLAAPLVLAASLVFLRTRLTPRWFAWAGFIVALGCLLGFLGVTTGLFLLWVVVVAVLLMRYAAGASSTAS